MTRWIGVAIVTLVSVLALQLGAAAAGDGLEVKNYNGTTYMSGGAGEDERQALQSVAGDYPLKIVGALSTGDYVADARVVIRNARGEKVLDARTDGPWLFARLAPGVYQVESIYGGEMRRQTVRVGSGGQTVVMMRWPEDSDR
jgi:hypothetical protein